MVCTDHNVNYTNHAVNSTDHDVICRIILDIQMNSSDIFQVFIRKDIIGKTKSTVFQNKKYKKNHGVLNTIYIIHKTTRSPFQNEAFQF